MENFVLSMLLLPLLFSFASAAWNNNVSASASDQHSLLAFKAAITFDPNNSFQNWNPNISFCNWTGVTCSPNMRTLVALNLSDMALEGVISPLIGNLSSLQSLDLSGNALHGHIPPQLGQLSSANQLLLHRNRLQGNIPPTLYGCRKLVDLVLSFNQLEGSIPVELGLLPHLEGLYLGGNHLTDYGLGGGVSIKGDVYNYGILLLEMVARKRPTNVIFVGDRNMRNWVRSTFPNKPVDIFDSKMLRNVNMEQNRCLVSFIHVGLLCTNESPQV